LDNKIEIGLATLYLGDCLNVLKTMPDCSVDSIVTDPPYGLSFMSKKWDYDVPSVEIWAECLRVLKPGGHLLAFAGTRTQHRMAVRIEDAGFEIRDMIAWVYGSGFPKSLDVSRAIDKAAGAEREVVGPNKFSHLNGQANANCYGAASRPDATSPATEAAQQWQGWGTALKPALEPITVARKPLISTVAENVLAHGTGAINIDGCRVAHSEECRMMAPSQANIASPSDKCRQAGRREAVMELKPESRWPANLIHDGSEEVLAGFPDGAPAKAGRTAKRGGSNWHGRDGLGTPDAIGILPADQGGSAARFFYCAKASKRDRDEGLEGFKPAKTNDGRKVDADNADQRGATKRANVHPTVKPTDLMRYLCRLVTQPGGVVLDPFMGSGSTGKASFLEGFKFVGIEMDQNYFEISKARIENAQRQEKLFE
jgi:DNA modification methylase